MRKALVFYGGWDGHQPEAFANIYKQLLEELGVDVEIRDSQEPLQDADLLAKLDLIVPCWTMGEFEGKASANLENAVRHGTALAGAHGGTGDAFRKDTNYNFIVGGQFVAHQPGFWDYTVRIQKKDDPIMAGIEDFTYHSEQYYMHVDPAIEVLADSVFHTADQEWASWADGCVMPVVWKKMHGKGRVFYSALGHAPEEYEKFPQAQEILKRGFAWALNL